jgi:hypothetical protein
MAIAMVDMAATSKVSLPEGMLRRLGERMQSVRHTEWLKCRWDLSCEGKNAANFNLAAFFTVSS